MIDASPLHLHPTLPTLARAAKARALASRFRPLFRARGLLFAITGYSLAVTGAPSPIGELVFAVGFLELFEVSPLRFATVALWFAFSSSVRLPFTLALTETHLLLSRAGVSATVLWHAVSAAVETDSQFTLLVPGSFPLPVPKAQLTPPHSPDGLRSFLTTVTTVRDARTPPSPLFGGA